MQIAIKPELEQRILNKLQDGKYKNIDDLLAIALQLLEDRDNKERKLPDLREKITAGTEQIRQGKVIDGELVFQRFQDKFEQILSGKTCDKIFP